MKPFEDVGARAVMILSPGDNIAVAVRDIAAGEKVELDGRAVIITAPVLTGHKIAARPIASGERVIKYGAPIGKATAAIAPGETVHLHNLTSDYLPTYTLDEGHEFLKEPHP